MRLWVWREGEGGGGRRDYSGKFFLAKKVVVRYWRVESSRHSIHLVGERVRVDVGGKKA